MMMRVVQCKDPRTRYRSFEREGGGDGLVFHHRASPPPLSSSRVSPRISPCTRGILASFLQRRTRIVARRSLQEEAGTILIFDSAFRERALRTLLTRSNFYLWGKKPCTASSCRRASTALVLPRMHILCMLTAVRFSEQIVCRVIQE
jgi:hypothetical protein